MIIRSNNHSCSDIRDRNNRTNRIKKATQDIIASSGVLVTYLSTMMSEHFHPQERMVATENLLKQGSEFIQSFGHVFTKHFIFSLLPLGEKDISLETTEKKILGRSDNMKKIIVPQKKTLMRAMSGSAMVVSEASEALIKNQITTAPEVTFQGAIVSGIMVVGKSVIDTPEAQAIGKKMVKSLSGKLLEIKRSASMPSLNY